MAYFINFPQINYKFGNENTGTAVEDISAYVDVIDQVKNQSAFYRNYTILDGDRPDVLSQKLYGTTDYHWTFYFMNDHLRRQGWPLPYADLLAKAQKDYPNTTVVTRDLLFNKFDVGDTVTGNSSAAEGIILKRNLDLGQLVIKVTNNKSFTDSELISDGTDTVTVQSSSEEYNSAHHYTNNGVIVDIDPENGPGVLLTKVTYLDEYVTANDSLKEINIIKPDNIDDVTKAFEEAMSGV